MILLRTISYTLLIGGAFLITTLSMSTSVYAHVTGASFNSTSSPYVFDIGYDPVTFTAGEYERFDFILRDEKTGNPVPFDQIWVRITNDDNTLLATGLFHQTIGPTTLLYVFPAPGSYKVEPSFRDADGNEIAVTSFPITVTSGGGVGGTVEQYAILSGVFMAGCLIGAFGLRALLKRKRA